MTTEHNVVTSPFVRPSARPSARPSVSQTVLEGFFQFELSEMFSINIFYGHDDLTQCRYKSVRPSVGRSVGRSVRPSVHPFVRPSIRQPDLKDFFDGRAKTRVVVVEIFELPIGN
jgi:hypothetical protein